MMDIQSGKSSGYVFVDFESKESAEKALIEFQGEEIDGEPIKLDISNSKFEVKPEVTNTNNERLKNIGDVPFRPSNIQFIDNLEFNADRDKLFINFKAHDFLKYISMNSTFSHMKRWCLLILQHAHKALPVSDINN
jgi:RNA recognition motif-containing protein